MLYDSTILYRSFYVFVAASALFGLFLVYLVRPVESHREFVVHSLSTFEIVAVVAAVVYFVLVDLYFYLGYFDCCFALVDLAFGLFVDLCSYLAGLCRRFYLDFVALVVVSFTAIVPV